MLHFNTISADLAGLYELLLAEASFNNLYLVGGTALALQIGHRKSIDLDFYSHSPMNMQNLVNDLSALGKLKIVNQTENILNAYLNNIKLDVIYQNVELLKPILKFEAYRLASIEDIAAMKLLAITNRGSKKDFIDFHFILKEFTLKELLNFYQTKFPQHLPFTTIKSLTYFDDADLQPMPLMLMDVTWEEVKDKIKRSSKTFGLG